MPRKTGLTLVRHGQQFDLVLQAETFAISGAKIHLDEDSDAQDLEQRIESIRDLGATVDLLFQAFCEQRVDTAWKKTHAKMKKWLATTELKQRKPAAA